MTATINPPDRGPETRRRPPRFSSLEILGFTDAESTWYDSPIDAPAVPDHDTLFRGRHEAGPDPLAGWRPEEVGNRLSGSNVRWGLVVLAMLAVAAAAAFGYWLWQRPAAEAQASQEAVAAQAGSLEAVLASLGEVSGALIAEQSAVDSSALDSVESEARALFDASGALPAAGNDVRSAASQAASATLDGIRLVRGAAAYRAAVTPVLTVPSLETDPELIALDEAARSFGVWQHDFDEVRTALPEGVLSEVTQDLDILSGDLAAVMGRYVDALRQDDQAAAQAVLLDLSNRLSQAGRSLDQSLETIQERVGNRLTEAENALERILGG